jgi:hypothetical protein
VPGFQEPENEAVASHVMEFIGIPHVNFELTEVNGNRILCARLSWTQKTDLVSAYYIADRLSNMPDDESLKYYFFLGWCEKIGITDARVTLDRIFIVDFIL